MSFQSDTRMLLTGAVVVLSGSALILIAVLERREPLGSARAEPTSSAGQAPAARSYRELRGGRRGANEAMYPAVAEGLADGVADLAGPASSSGPARAEAMAQRRAGRAYDGAPPTVPHEVTQRTLDCVGCHASGAALANKMAPKMSHRAFPSCTQCHVPRAAGTPISPELPAAVMAESSFVGLSSRGSGSRAWDGAPPTIPHSTDMRSDCMSCHGPTGAPGLRTSHPDRASCVQCHAASAIFDQRPPTSRDQETRR